MDKSTPARTKRQTESRVCWDYCGTYPVGSPRRGCLSDCRRADMMNTGGPLPPECHTYCGGHSEASTVRSCLEDCRRSLRELRSLMGSMDPAGKAGLVDPPDLPGERRPEGAGWQGRAMLNHPEKENHLSRTKRQVESRACWDYCDTYPAGNPQKRMPFQLSSC